ncbi:MAG: hypothetical protein ABF629_11015 [Sporolactobacillus sp.]|uniref:hypothetical protein n=1 Tax=Sporolactobacillus sp. STSJ-5 TaxID=2965076 RepID=UPI002105227B|nr:hypothetical protein [Sporolactobacillus sp. STSJ-5]MCQ2008581.1 hypothetical protein [Sporolactobacillus sp. STSJ-5]
MKRNAEFILSLIGSILSTIVWLFLCIVIIATAAAYTGSADDDASITIFLIGNIISLPIIVFAWLSTFKVREASSGWSIYLIVGGSIFIFSPFFVSGVLFLIAGILSVTHKTPTTHSISE